MSEWLAGAMPHLIVAPIALPMVTAAIMLLLGGRRGLQATLGIASAAAGLFIAVVLLHWVDTRGASQAVGVYLPSNWHVPFGIVLAVDRLSALMLVLAAILGVSALVFSTAHWDRAGVHFHTLFQIQLMGLNGAFLTADIFNLFVFFEVTLAASYGLLLHGSGRARARSGLHYLAMNLVASSFFLVGVAMLYGVTGTLNMADMARKLPLIPAVDRGLLHAGAAILGIAFLIKAAAWPLNHWLVGAYSAAAAPVAAIFTILTKVGVYALLRLWTLMLPSEEGGAASFAGEALVYIGLGTLAVASVAMLTAHQPRRLAALAIVISAGTVLAAIGFASAPLIGAALVYLLASTLAGGALFMLAELVDRARESRPVPAEFAEDEADSSPAYVIPDAPVRHEPVDEEAPVGRAIPFAMAFLGLAFGACALLVAGLPPLPGFLAKLAMLTALPDASGIAPPAATWTMFALLILSGFLCLLAFSRAGIRYFWAPQGRAVPRLRVIESAPIAALLLLALALTVFAAPALRYSQAAALGLLDPSPYIEAIMSATPGKRPAQRSLGSP